MWIRITSRLLIDVTYYSRFIVRPMLAAWWLWGDDNMLLEFETEQKAKDALDELTLKIAALKECKCQQS